MLLALLLAAALPDETAIQSLLQGTPREVVLPRGTYTLHSPVRVPEGFRLRGTGTVLRAAADFTGKALLLCARNVTLSGLNLEGNLSDSTPRAGIAPWDRTFFDFYDGNAIAADRADGLVLRNLRIRSVPGYAVLIRASRQILIEDIVVEDSGSLNEKGRNNTTGGILLEEGTRDFIVRRSRFVRVRGNAVWTHSLYTSPRNGPGRIEYNRFDTVGRDAIQAGHATVILVRFNTGQRIGWPSEIVDVETGGTPVGIDTAGNVDLSVYRNNRFSETNGKCIDLDGFHHGEVSGNICRNAGPAEKYPFGHYGIVFNNTNPDMQSEKIRVTGNHIDGTKFGGIFVIGHEHVIEGNRLTRLNLARCNDEEAKFGCLYDPKQPDLLRSGIYFGAGAERPAPVRDNVVKNNVISGHGMMKHCIAFAPGVPRSAAATENNVCRNSSPAP